MTTEVRDYYQVLGLKREAGSGPGGRVTNADVEAAYRKAIAEVKDKDTPLGKEIEKAYEVLKEEDNRMVYDAHGPTMHPDPSTVPHLTDGVVDLYMTLHEIYHGVIKKVVFFMSKMDCKKCEGTGGTVNRCTTCKGQCQMVKTETVNGRAVPKVTKCATCDGTGKQIAVRCTECRGGKQFFSMNRVTLGPIAPGVTDGAMMHMKKEGFAFRIKEIPHESFSRMPDKPENLVKTLTITLAESIAGFKKTLDHLDGKPRALESPTEHLGDIYFPGYIQTLPGLGMPVFQDPATATPSTPIRYGDLLLVFDVIFPTSADIDEDSRKKIALLLAPPAPSQVQTAQDEGGAVESKSVPSSKPLTSESGLVPPTTTSTTPTFPVTSAAAMAMTMPTITEVAEDEKLD